MNILDLPVELISKIAAILIYDDVAFCTFRAVCKKMRDICAEVFKRYKYYIYRGRNDKLKCEIYCPEETSMSMVFGCTFEEKENLPLYVENDVIEFHKICNIVSATLEKTAYVNINVPQLRKIELDFTQLLSMFYVDNIIIHISPRLVSLHISSDMRDSDTKYIIYNAAFGLQNNSICAIQTDRETAFRGSAGVVNIKPPLVNILDAQSPQLLEFIDHKQIEVLSAKCSHLGLYSLSNGGGVFDEIQKLTVYCDNKIYLPQMPRLVELFLMINEEDMQEPADIEYLRGEAEKNLKMLFIDIALKPEDFTHEQNRKMNKITKKIAAEFLSICKEIETFIICCGNCWKNAADDDRYIKSLTDDAAEIYLLYYFYLQFGHMVDSFFCGLEIRGTLAHLTISHEREDSINMTAEFLYKLSLETYLSQGDDYEGLRYIDDLIQYLYSSCGVRDIKIVIKNAAEIYTLPAAFCGDCRKHLYSLIFVLLKVPHYDIDLLAANENLRDCVAIKKIE